MVFMIRKAYHCFVLFTVKDVKLLLKDAFCSQGCSSSVVVFFLTCSKFLLLHKESFELCVSDVLVSLAVADIRSPVLFHTSPYS